jgi:crotonobetainyl-CoA:carnitine CoA-transferase CaiB-like acyl-CoA transferase
LRAAPRHGQDTDDIMRELGLAEEQINALRERGIIV